VGMRLLERPRQSAGRASRSPERSVSVTEKDRHASAGHSRIELAVAIEISQYYSRWETAGGVSSRRRLFSIPGAQKYI